MTITALPISSSVGAGTCVGAASVPAAVVDADAVLSLPWKPAGELDPHRRIDPTTLPPHVTDRLDLHHAVWVLTQHAA